MFLVCLPPLPQKNHCAESQVRVYPCLLLTVILSSYFTPGLCFLIYKMGIITLPIVKCYVED